jgi:hypothetical protein
VWLRFAPRAGCGKPSRVGHPERAASIGCLRAQTSDHKEAPRRRLSIFLRWHWRHKLSGSAGRGDPYAITLKDFS